MSSAFGLLLLQLRLPLLDSFLIGERVEAVGTSGDFGDGHLTLLLLLKLIERGPVRRETPEFKSDMIRYSDFYDFFLHLGRLLLLATSAPLSTDSEV